jgi:hypothetical protein
MVNRLEARLDEASVASCAHGEVPRGDGRNEWPQFIIARTKDSGISTEERFVAVHETAPRLVKCIELRRLLCAASPS